MSEPAPGGPVGAGKAPCVYNIPPGVSFVDALATGLLARFGADPLALSRVTLLLPTRRACRALQDAFLRASGEQALLLPRLQPLGDIDAEELLLGAEAETLTAAGADLPLAIRMLERQLLLGRLIRHWGRVRGQAPGEDQAVRLAAELARLLDQVETEGLDIAGLEHLVPEAYAEHWQITLRFLRILMEQWPAVQAERGRIGPAERRRRLLEAQAEAWRRSPPSDPVIAAGSTGSIPATAALLAVIASLPAGEVVLPGLDRDSDEATWDAIERDPCHPQHGLARFLSRLGVAREAVEDWPGCTVPETNGLRARVATAALAPAEAEPALRAFAGRAGEAALEAALAPVERIDCPGPGEEARVIALILRRALEQPDIRAALVTPDRGLARRVAAELGRWGVSIDDSAGTPLADTPPVTFLRLIAELAGTDMAPLALLAALKHPLAAGGMDPATFRARVRELEIAVLRGPRPAPGVPGLRRALRGADKRTRTRLRPWLAELEARLGPLLRALRRSRSLAAVVGAHIACAEALAASEAAGGPERLWAGDAGTAAAEWIAELHAAAEGTPALTGERYPALFDGLLTGHVVRPRYGAHPRLSLWGPLEARLQQADLIVLGGLNEGTWPAEVDPGPWLSRPMQSDFGLPPPERRIGLAAHDFAQAFCAPRVVLTRATRVEGAPTVPSRWLLRLDALLEALGLGDVLTREAGRWLAWAEALDRPAESVPTEPPAPRPPLAARPRSLSVTRIETWMRDPYDLYAERILGLYALDPIDADPGAAELGSLVHRALDRFLKAHPDALPEDPEAALLEIGEQVFAGGADKPGVRAFWWPRFRRIARWFAEVERTYRAGLAASRGEVSGALELGGPGGPFTLTAKADRIDRLAGGGLAILDYKTGSVPQAKDVERGASPQLPLEAAIARAGGFKGIAPEPVVRLAYWKVSGGEPPGEIGELKLDPEAAAEAALVGLRALIARFDDPDTPYHARPRPDWTGRFSDYGHLARIKEWAAGLGPEGEG